MIVFSSLAPETFQRYVGYGPLSYTRAIYVFNLLSYDIRYPKLDRLIPKADYISAEAIQNDDSAEFEFEYFRYLDTAEPAYLDLMSFLTKEYDDGSNLIIIETLANSQFSESVVSSLTKYLYTRYGIIAITVNDIEDMAALSIQNSVFSPAGLQIMDNDITVLNAICPEMIQRPEVGT